MKKKLALLLALLMLALSACGQVVPIVEETPPPSPIQPTPTPEATPSPTPEPTPTPVPTATPEPPPTPTPEPTPEPVIDAAWWAENMPAMDGSTSLIPLEAGIRAALLEINMEEAEKQVVHSTTYGSFSNLIHSKSADLIFSVPLSKQQLEEAANAGVELEQMPIAREGFVFVVNKDNPVDSLTQQQIRDIYSGKITNWSEVGGSDLPIIAYQRNGTSGSQNYMVDFMGDTHLMDAPSELRPGSMALVIEVISANNYAEQSIGYSVYSYAADMYTGINNTKFIAIDGVYPTKETMARGEYPLLSENYAIFRADEPEGSPVRRLCDWLTSEDGQLAIAGAGYVPVMDIDYVYSPAEPPEPYSAVGCGPEDWDTSLFENIAVLTSKGNQLPVNVTLPENFEYSNSSILLSDFHTGIKYSINCLTNDTLEAEVNAWLAETVDKADADSGSFLDFLKDKKAGYSSFSRSYYQYYVQASRTQVYFPSCSVKVSAINGYLYAIVAQPYYHSDDLYYYNAYCRIWDMFSGSVISTEELFRSGFDIDEYLNAFINSVVMAPYNAYGVSLRMKNEFLYLPTDGWTLTPEAIYISADNPYFQEGVRFDFGGDNMLCTEIFRDMSGQFDEQFNGPVAVSSLKQMSHLPNYAYANDGLFLVKLLDENIGNREVRAKINADVMQRAEALTVEGVADFLREIGFNEADYSEQRIRSTFSQYIWNMVEYGDRFAVFSSTGGFYYYPDSGEIVWPPALICFIYDLHTGELIELEDILVDNCSELAYVSPMFDGEVPEGNFLDELWLNDLWRYPYNSENPDLTVFLYMRDPETLEKAYRVMLPASAFKAYHELD